MHFDSTISLGNLLTSVSMVLLAAFTWRDLTWRIKNLETWRTEHMLDADGRDRLLIGLKRILDHMQWQTDYVRGINRPPPPTDGSATPSF